MDLCVYVGSGSNLHLLNPLDGGIVSVASPCQSRGLACVADDWVIATQRKEAAMHVFHRGQKSPHLKCRLAEPMGPVMVSPDGAYCFAGGSSGKLYAWDLWSGQLLRSWHGHHKPVRALGMTDDSSYLVTGGDDAVISVWNILDVVNVDDNGAESVIRDFHSWSDHSQAITALYVGVGGVRGRVFSASLDRTARVFEIFSRQLLCTISCDVFLTAVVATPDESWLLAGAGDGTIIAADLRAAACRSSGVLAGGVTMEGAQSQERLEGHIHPVCALLSVDQGTLLISASEDGTVKTWDFASRQCIQTTDLKAPITCMEAAGLVDAKVSLRTQPTDTDLAPLAPLKKFGSAGKLDAAHCFLPLKRSLVDNETEKPLKPGQL